MLLHEFVYNAIKHHRILCLRIVMDADGTAYFQANPSVPEIHLEAYTGTCEQLLRCSVDPL